MITKQNLQAIRNAADWLHGYASEDPYSEAGRDAAMLSADLYAAIAVDQSANDDTPEQLRAAAYNWDLLRAEWHKPAKCKATAEDIAYYRNSHSGSHGWMCTKCYGIVQTG